MDPSLDDMVAWSWRRGQLSWKLHASQRVIYGALEALPPKIKTAVILCSRRWGKSYLGAIKGAELCLREPNRIVRIIGPDIKQTKMIVSDAMAKITEELPRLGLSNLVEPVKSENMYRIGRSALYLGGFDSQEDSLRGGEAHEIIVEETGSANPELYHYQMRSVLKPQLLKTRGRMIHMTTLPKESDHPFIIDTIPEAQLDNAFYSYTIYDDPLATPEIIADAIKDSGGEHSIDFQREYLNKIVRDPRIVVVPTFDKQRHVALHRDPLETNWAVVIDWGGTVDKTVALLMTYDFLAARDWIVDEKVFDANTPTSEIVRGLCEWEAQYQVSSRIADCTGQIKVDLGHEHSYLVTSPQKQNWQININELVAAFAQDLIAIHPRCRFLIQSLESGRLTTNRKDFERTVALGHCDAIAALMYGHKCLDRTAPYILPEVRNTANMHVRFKEPEGADIAHAVQPKSFMRGTRGFGSYQNR